MEITYGCNVVELWKIVTWCVVGCGDILYMSK
jgi:hypothetical protein